MSEQPGGFRTPEAEVLRLLDELASMRDLMRDISGKLSRLEMRAKRAFPVAAQVHDAKVKAREEASETASITAADALKHYDIVVKAAREISFERASEILNEMALPDLMLIHREVGLPTGKSKPSKKLILNALLGRVKESVLLTRHSTRPLEGS